MFGSQILEVGIGLVLVYTLLSLICTSLKEIIEGRLKNRSKDLAKGVLMLLAADQRATKALYDHPLISGLYPPKSLPSYIPARSFALAVLDLAGVKSGMPNAPTPSLEDRLNAIGAQIDGSSLPDDVKTVLRRLADDAQGDTRRFRENVERWFDGAMDRVSGWYKRRAQWIILGLGLLVVVAANADTISIAYALAHESGGARGARRPEPRVFQTSRRSESRGLGRGSIGQSRGRNLQARRPARMELDGG